MKTFASVLILCMSQMLSAQFLNPTLDEWIDSSPMRPFEHLAEWKTTSRIFEAAPSLSVIRGAENERIFARIISNSAGGDSSNPGYIQQEISTQNLSSISYISRCDSLAKLGLCLVQILDLDERILLSDTTAVESDSFELNTIVVRPDIIANHEKIIIRFEANGFYFPLEPEDAGFAVFDIDDVRADFISAVNDQVLDPTLLTVYPNPSQGVFQIDFEGRIKPDFVQIFNLQGQVVWSGKFQTRLDLRKLSSGDYILSIQTAEGIISKQISIIEP